MKVLIAAVSLLFAGNSFAGVIYTNLGPGDSYGGATTGGCSCTFSDDTVFRASNTGVLDHILVPVNDATTLVTFNLFTNSGGAPGTLLESWVDVTTTNPDITNENPLLTLQSAVHPTLTAGDIYWFEAVSGPIPSGPTYGLAWGTSTQLTCCGLYEWIGDPSNGLVHIFPDSAPPAIELDTASSVPEPGTDALLGFGLLSLVAIRRKAQP